MDSGRRSASLPTKPMPGGSSACFPAQSTSFGRALPLAPADDLQIAWQEVAGFALAAKRCRTR